MMLSKIRTALALTLVALAAVSLIDSASALGFFDGGVYGYWGFDYP